MSLGKLEVGGEATA